LNENLKVRVPDDPSTMVRPKILNVETFCLKCDDSASEFELRWDEGKDVWILTPKGDVWNA